MTGDEKLIIMKLKDSYTKGEKLVVEIPGFNLYRAGYLSKEVNN
jgi:hypothetical protein